MSATKQEVFIVLSFQSYIFMVGIIISPIYPSSVWNPRKQTETERVGSSLGSALGDKPLLGVRRPNHWRLPGRDVTWGKAAVSSLE